MHVQIPKGLDVLLQLYIWGQVNFEVSFNSLQMVEQCFIIIHEAKSRPNQLCCTRLRGAIVVE